MGGERLPGARRPAQARKIKVGPMGERGAKVAKEVLSKESGGRQSQLLCLILFFFNLLAFGCTRQTPFGLSNQ